MTTIYDKLGSDPRKWAAEFCSQGGLFPESGRPGGFTYEFFVNAMGAVEQKWQDRMRQIVAELERRANTSVGDFIASESMKPASQYAEVRMDAYSDAVEVVRRIGGLDEQHP